jgi:hypothetical protein
LINGLRLRRAESRVLASVGGISIHTSTMPVHFPTREWDAVRGAAVTSFVLWCVLVVLGVVLGN